MTKIPSEVIIVGGGASIKPHISELQPVLATKFTILINYAYKHFNGTFLTFYDRDFYKPRPDKDNPDIYEELKQLPLIIGINKNGVDEFKLPNTILFERNNNSYQRENSLKNGFYTNNLAGVFSISLASFLLDYSGTIYLLGFDWTRRPIDIIDKSNYTGRGNIPTHYYENIKHRGVGLVGYYETHNYYKDFDPFLKEKDVKIYNVSLESNINCFEKISYEQMFKQLNQDKINQEELRQEINIKLKSL